VLEPANATDHGESCVTLDTWRRTSRSTIPS
jgi:hypothetical protein